MEIYLITTIHNRESRWKYINEHLELRDIGVTTIIAPDYRIFQYAGLNERQSKHQSLTMAYLQIAQAAIFNDGFRYIVFEDDVCLMEDFMDELFKIHFNVPDDWDFLYATKTEHNRLAAKTIPINEYICKVESNWWETPITIWNTRMIETFNKRMMAKIANKEHLGNIDHELMKICEEGELNFYGSEKNIASGLSTARHLADETISFEGSIS